MIMMNRIFKNILLVVAIISVFSCKKDDNGSSNSVYEIRPHEEQEPIDDEAIQTFLKNNYFNEEEFLNADNIDDFQYDIEFYINEVLAAQDENNDGDMLDSNETVIGYDSNNDGVIDGNDIDNTTVFTRTPLFEYIDNVINGITIETKEIVVEDVTHILYILKIIEGGDEDINFCDDAFLSYEGVNLEKEIFDNALNPTWLDLSSTVKGFSESVSEFKTATSRIDNGDGTFTFEDFGVGAVFMPSGLGYYENAVGNINAYTPLVFKLKIYQSRMNDHDNDGIPTLFEDLNQNHDLRDDNTDGDNLANYLDENDDDDPVLTKDEVQTNTYVINDGDLEPVLSINEYEVDRQIDVSVVPNRITITTSTYIDTDNDGVLDYLDSDS